MAEWVVRDGSERDVVAALRRRNAALEEELARLAHFRRLCETSAVLIAQIDLAGRFVEFNDAWCQLLGYSRGELLRRSFLELVHADDLDATIAEAARLQAEGAYGVEFRNRFRRRDGGHVWLRWHSFTDLDAGRHYCVVEDISKKMKMKAVLEDTGRLAKVGGWEVELPGLAPVWSPEVYRIHEVPLGAPLDITMALDFYPEEVRGALLAAVEACVDRGVPYDLELPMITAKGRRIWVRTMGEAERDGDAIVRIFGTFQDISERRRAEEARRESEDRFRQIFERLPVAALVLADDGAVESNRRFDVEIALAPRGFADGSWLDEFPRSAEERAVAAAVWKGALEAGDGGSRGPAPELQIHGRDGRCGTYALRVVRHGGARTVFFEEVGERRAMVAAIASQGAVLRALHLISADASLDLDAKIDRLLELGCRHFGLESGLLTLRRGAQVEVAKSCGPLAADMPEGISVPLAGTITEAIGESMRPLVVRSSAGGPWDSEPWRSLGVRTILGAPVVADGAPVGALIFVGSAEEPGPSERDSDLVGLFGQWIGYESGRRLASVTLAAARDRAESASRAKSTFLATMSHELRTPMNGIIGMADILLAGGLDGARREQAATIKASGLALLGVLNQVLDLASVEAGKLTLEVEPFSPTAMIAGAIDLMRPLLGPRGQEIVLENHWPDAWEALGDELRLRQVVLNFLDNAIKFSPPGVIEVVLDGRIEGARPGLRIAVADRGPGIAAADVDRIFTPFEQVSGDAAERSRGVGLGLAICHEIAARMGGRVGCESALGEGSTFWVEVPLGRRSRRPDAGGSAEPEAGAGPRWSGRRILLAEDEPINRLVAATILEGLGCVVESVADGRAAQISAQGGRFDAILMDCRMPEMDGFAATAAIRGDERARGAHVPIVAITANAMAGDRERCLAAGMDDFVAKPLTIEALAAALERAWARR